MYRDDMKKTFNVGRKATDVKSGDHIFLRNDAKTDSLDPRYNGPFKVTATRPPNVTIDTGDGRTKIVHLDRCKVVPNENLNPPQQESTFVPADPPMVKWMITELGGPGGCRAWGADPNT